MNYAIFKNKWFWIIVASIIILLIVRRNWSKITSIFQRDFGDYGDYKINENDEARLKELAENLYQQIYSNFSISIDKRAKYMTDALALTDTELKWLARYYRTALTKGTCLFKDVDEEWLPIDSVDEDLMARLAKIGEKC
jgi:hypothetical protein